MIKTEQELKLAKTKLEAELARIKSHRQKMKSSGLTPKQIQLAIDPLLSFSLQLKEEIEEHEKIQRGEFDTLINLKGLGRLLIAIRISKQMKQRELAELLGVKEAQVSRDERNEYYGASIEKIQRVLDALGVSLNTGLQEQTKRSSRGTS